MQSAPNSIKQHSTSTTRLVLARLVVVGALTIAAAGVGAWLLGVAWLSTYGRVTSPGPASPAEIVTLAAATAAVAIAAWLALGALLELLSHAPGRLGRVAGQWSERLTPALARRIAAFLLGIGLGVAGGPSQAVATSRSGIVASASEDRVAAPEATDGAPVAPRADFDHLIADRSTPPPHLSTTPAPAPSTSSAPRGSTTAPDPGFAPSSPAPAPSATSTATPTAAPTAPAPGFTPIAPAPGFTPTAPKVRPQVDPGPLTARPGTDERHEVVVHRGDSLWSIAAEHLGRDASDAEIARAWPVWFALNRDRIGADPDLILPGQILRIPSAAQLSDPDQIVSVTP